eukprot:2501127-Pyramimonas_sp.AAC.1
MSVGRDGVSRDTTSPCLIMKLDSCKNFADGGRVAFSMWLALAPHAFVFKVCSSFMDGGRAVFNI